MNLVSCNVIEDLLPLYAEDMLSEDSKKLVEDHLDECEGCSEYLDELKAMASLPVETNTEPLKKIQNTLQKKKWHAIILTTLFTLFVGALAVVFMTTPDYLTYSEDLMTISETADGITILDFNEEVAGYDLESYQAGNGEGTVYHLTAWKTTWHDLTNKDEIAPVVLNPSGEEVESVYYYQTDGSADRLVYGAEQHASGGVVTLPRLSLNYFFGLAAGTLLVCLGILFTVRSNKKYLDRTIKITLLPISYLLAQLLVTGWNATTYSAVRNFTAILLIAILLYGLLWTGVEWIRSGRLGKFRNK